MKYLIAITLLLILSACLAAPDLETGEDCWRYGVAEDNTGRMSNLDIEDIPRIKVDYETLGKECGFETGEMAWSNRSIKATACFKLDNEGGKIYLLKLYSGKVDLYQEQCHALLGREHNACTAYGIGNSEADCKWNVTHKGQPLWAE